MYYKIEAIKIKMSLDRLYDELESGKNLTDIFKELNKSKNEDIETVGMYISDEVLHKVNSRVLSI
jgi:hypothetical protein